MSMYPNAETRPVELEYGTDNKAVFNFFNAVYAWMAVGLAITAGTAFYFSKTELWKVLYGNGGFVILAVMLASWGVAIAAQRAALNIGATAGTILFLLYSVLMGAMVSAIFIIYTDAAIASAFLLTAGVFGATSIYGFVTKRDMTGWGSYLFMALFGLIIASAINIFFANSAMSWVITYAVLFLSIALTAYETQQLKNFAYEYGDNPQLASRMAIYGSIVLYISFLNMFMAILRIFGERR